MCHIINECLQVAIGLSKPNKENTDDDNDNDNNGNVNKICFNFCKRNIGKKNWESKRVTWEKRSIKQQFKMCLFAKKRWKWDGDWTNLKESSLTVSLSLHSFYMVFSFGFDKSFFYDVIKQCFATFFGCSAATLYRLFYYDTWSTQTAFSLWIDNIFLLSLSVPSFSLSRFVFYFILLFCYFVFVVVVIISASTHKITQQMPELLYFPPMLIDHVNVWCAFARLDKCLITTFITPPIKKISSFDKTMRRNVHQIEVKKLWTTSVVAFSLLGKLRKASFLRGIKWRKESWAFLWKKNKVCQGDFWSQVSLIHKLFSFKILSMAWTKMLLSTLKVRQRIIINFLFIRFEYSAISKRRTWQIL